MSVIERLESLLSEQDDTIEKLERRVRDLENMLEGSMHGWSVPRQVPDDGVLPVPRLEVAWWSDETSQWAEYRLVRKHLLGSLEITPLGKTRISGYGEHATRPWENLATQLPFRDGAHALHDAAHMRLPLYVVTPSGSSVRIDNVETNYESQQDRPAAPPRTRRSRKQGEVSMGTRADFYVGTGLDSTWIGSIAWDGYRSVIPDAILNATSEEAWRKEVGSFIESREEWEDDFEEIEEECEECEECGAGIPDTEGGSLVNKHHAPSCSLYDPKAG